MIRLSRKFIKRSIVGLALLAPIVYLFGNLFASLNGAHGAFPFAGDYEVVTEQKRYDYNQLFADIDYTSSNPKVVLSQTKGSYSIGVDVLSELSSASYLSWKLPSFIDGHTYVIRGDGNINIQPYCYINGTYSPLFNGNSYKFVYGANVIRNPLMVIETSVVVGSYSAGINVTDLTQMYGVGNEPSKADFLAMCPDYTLPVASEIRVVDTYAQPDNYQFIFNQFFGRSNFLSQWGEDALSDTPHGFAPFGVLLKTVDENVLHLSNEQIGLMGYGYFYYCAHVLIFAFMFECATFFISWCSSIFNKFGGKDNGD